MEGSQPAGVLVVGGCSCQTGPRRSCQHVWAPSFPCFHFLACRSSAACGGPMPQKMIAPAASKWPTAACPKVGAVESRGGVRMHACAVAWMRWRPCCAAVWPLGLAGRSGVSMARVQAAHPPTAAPLVEPASHMHPAPPAGERAVFQPRSATFQQEVGEDIRSVLEAALLQARAAARRCACASPAGALQ